MALLLGVVGVLLVGCSTYEVTEEDWHMIGTYERTKYLPDNFEVEYGPFISKKEDTNPIETYEEFETSCIHYKDYLKLRNGLILEDFRKEDLLGKGINQYFFNHYLIYTFWLYVDTLERDSGISVENIYIDGKTLHFPIVFNATATYHGSSWGDTQVVIFLAVKKSVLDKVSKVEMEFIKRSDNSRGSKYYQYK